MNIYVKYLFYLVLIAIGTSRLNGQVPDKYAESYLELPNSGVMKYRYREGQKGPEIVSIRYPGSSEWLVEQKHPASHWHKITTLERVEINAADDLKPEAMKYISSLRTVTNLDISGTLFYRGALAPLESMTSLKALSIDFNDQLSRLSSKSHDPAPYEIPRGDCFKFMEKLALLEDLTLWPECDESTYVRICNLKKLERLALGQFGSLADDKAAKVSNLANLKYLSLQKLAKPTLILKGLRGHGALIELRIDDANLEAVDIEQISTIRRLETFSCRGSHIGSLSQLKMNTELKKLNLHYEKYDASGEYSFLKSLPKLEEIVLLGYGKESKLIEDFSLEHLRGHNNLKGLGVHAILRNDDIAILESMKNLKELGVGNLDDSEWCKKARRRLPGVIITGANKK